MKSKIYNELSSKDLGYLISCNFIKKNVKNIEKKSNILRQINFYKRANLLQSIFEIENKLSELFDNNLTSFATLKISKTNPKTISKYIVKHKSREIIEMINNWFNDKNRNFKVAHKSRDKVTISIVFRKLSLGQKIFLISHLNHKLKLKYFATSKSKMDMNRIIDLLHMLRKMRNHLSHEYWCLDFGWVRGIIYSKNKQYRVYNKDPMNFFNEINVVLKIFDDNIYRNTEKVVFDILNLRGKFYVYKHRNKIFGF